ADGRLQTETLLFVSRKKRQLRSIATAFCSGGGGNCTRVSRHFSTGFYVCSLSSASGRNLAAPPTLFARTTADKQAPVRTNQLRGLANAASGTAGPEGPTSGVSEPDLATKPQPLRQRSRTRGSRY